MRKIPGIYTITIPTGEFYLGSSVNTYMRKHQHWNCLKTGTHNNVGLISAYEKYGRDGLKFEVIFSLLPGVKTLDVEQEFLDEMKPSLNMTLLSHSPMRDPIVAAKTAKTLSEGPQYVAQRNAARLLANKALSKAVIRVTDGMRFESAQAAARFMGYTKRIADITTAVSGMRRCREGHFWIFEGSVETIETLKARETQRKFNMRMNKAISVVRIRDGKVYKSSREAALDNGLVSGGSIIYAIKNDATAAGENWAYAIGNENGDS